LSIRLKQRAGMLLVAAVALLAAALAILPGVAEAQDGATGPTTSVAEGADGVGPTNASPDAPAGPPPLWPNQRPDGQADSIPQPSSPASEPAARSEVVVEPGDSLWSISEKRLHPNASPQQVLSEVERIFALNRDRSMGDDPGLILAGQVLSLPPAADEPAAAAAPAAVEPAADEPAVAAVEPAADEPAVAAAPAAVEPAAPVPAREPVALPELPVVEATPVARLNVEPSSPESLSVRRRLLGLAVVVLSLVTAILMVWKLPMKRALWDPEPRRKTEELWRLSAEHQRPTGVLSDKPTTPKSERQQLSTGEVRVEPTGFESPRDSRKEVNSDAV
jgi:hypothetical protein